MDDKELCNIACSPTLDGYRPNPFYEAGYCPQYMKNQCYADGTMFAEQWETHQKNIKHHNAQKLFATSFGIEPQVYSYAQGNVQMPPTTRVVMQSYENKVDSKSPKSSTKKKSTKKTTDKKKPVKKTTDKKKPSKKTSTKK